MSKLSEDIIIGLILTRLPVKSIIRFRCVCQSWKYILSNPDPQFITSHITHTSQNPDYESLIMVISKNCRWSVDILSRSRFSYTQIDNALPRYFKIVGCIDGLVCLFYSHRFLLWNPATGLAKTIVPPQHYWGNKKFTVYGYGFDYVESEFKLVVCYREEKSFKGVVYTSNSNSWNGLVIPDFLPFASFTGDPDIIVEGCPYWTAGRGYDWFIVKFVTGSNQFKEFLFPHRVRACKYHFILVNVMDRLAAMAYYMDDTLVDVFHLDEECGVWSKTYTVGPIICVVGKFSHCFKYGREIVFCNAKMLYDPRTNGIKILGDGQWDFLYGCSYTPSLMFLPGMEPLHTQSHWRSPEGKSEILISLFKDDALVGLLAGDTIGFIFKFVTGILLLV